MRAVRRPRLAPLGPAVRVALTATLVIAAVSVVVVGAVDAFLNRRVLWEVDQRLSARLAAVSHLADPRSTVSAPDDRGTDGAPVFVWWVPAGGPPAPLTLGAPAFPAEARAGVHGPVTATTGGASFRYTAMPLAGGWLVAGQDLSGPGHIGVVLRTGELIIGPVLLGAVFLGVLVIQANAVAPVERARRRQLEFTADASHELRTPITVIAAETELALDARAGADQRPTLRRIADETGRLQRIVEDLLWLARSDSAPPPPVAAPVDLTGVVGSCAERFLAVARSRRLELRIGPGGAAWVVAPAEWLDRLAGTLLDNACRYAPDGGVVAVRVTERGGRVALVVEDSGPGIDEAQRSRLFGRFQRGAPHPGGAGLGLAIADAVVRSTGGRWRLGRSPLGGARMEVSWRRANGATGAAPAATTNTTNTAATTTANPAVGAAADRPGAERASGPRAGR